jgi:hypothetical protein
LLLSISPSFAELTGQQTSDAKAGAVTSQDTSGTSAEGTVLQQQQQQQPNSPADAAIANPGAASSHGKQEGTKGSSTAMRVCMVLLWSGVLLVVGSLLAAAWLAPMLQEPVAAAGDDDLLYTFEADVGSLAVVPRCYAA